MKKLRNLEGIDITAANPEQINLLQEYMREKGADAHGKRKQRLLKKRQIETEIAKTYQEVIALFPFMPPDRAWELAQGQDIREALLIAPDELSEAQNQIVAALARLVPLDWTQALALDAHRISVITGVYLGRYGESIPISATEILMDAPEIAR